MTGVRAGQAFFLPATVLRGPLRVRALVGALTPDREALPVTDALVATDLDLASMSAATRVEGHLDSGLLDPVAQCEGLVIREVFGLHLRIDTGGLQGLGCL